MEVINSSVDFQIGLIIFLGLFVFRKVVIVEDCLSVLLNLLKNNASNQSYFREGSYIRRLVDFFELSSIGEKRWSAQKVSNVHLLLQVSFCRMISVCRDDNCF